jgi:hypothetical protein
MVRNWRVLIIPATIILVFAAGLFIYFIKQPDQVPQKPNTVQPPTDNPKFTWYIKFSVKDQKSTSYTEAASAPVAASGKRYFIGSGAVHPRYPLNAGGNPIQPIIPFGPLFISINRLISTARITRAWSLMIPAMSTMDYGRTIPTGSMYIMAPPTITATKMPAMQAYALSIIRGMRNGNDRYGPRLPPVFRLASAFVR